VKLFGGTGRGSRRRSWSRPGLAAVVVLAVLASTEPAWAGPRAGSGWHGLGWDLPPLQQTSSVPGVANKMRPAPGTGTTGRAMTAPPAVSWPAAASAEVDLPATKAGAKGPEPAAVGRTPVSLTRGHGRVNGVFAADATTATQTHGTGRVKLDVLGRDAVDRAGLRGVLLRVSPVSGDVSGPITVRMDYSGFAAAYGADFGRRLRLVSYPACVLSTPERPECRVATPLDVANTGQRYVVGEVTLPATEQGGAAVVAATPGGSSDAGDFTATSLSPAGTWSVNGDFSYNYPFTLPPAPGAADLTVGLSYSSAGVDGATSATNNQPSWVGDGWSLSAGGYIERSYKGCAQDLGGNNGTTKTGDLCWGTDNATLSLNGSTVLVKDRNSAVWHPRGDDGSRVERLTGTTNNGAKDGEYWRITKTDGTQYYFGLNRLPGWVDGKPETSSTLTVPVFGNNSGEPCYKAAFADSSCRQAWRWNLDYVVDPHGNAVAYYYQPEVNYYAVNATAPKVGTKYERGGYLLRMEYGLNTRVGGVFVQPPARVVFDTEERCVRSATVTCDPAQLSSLTASSWPDVPADQICVSDKTCSVGYPTFFTRRRLSAVTTQVANGSGGWNNANRWELGHSFPQTGDGSSAVLWLDSVRRTGLAGGSLTLPSTTFGGTAKANRTHASANYTSLTRNRITSVVNEMGGSTTITYTEPDCQSGDPAPASNTTRCYPVYWTPGGASAPQLDWFNKYLVTDLYTDGRTQLSQPTRVHYDYLGDAAWHYDENFLSEAKYRTWSQYRGYRTVRTTTGSANDEAGPQSVTTSLVMRGMEGQSVVNSLGESIPDGPQFQGQVRESLAYLDGQVIEGTVTDLWSSPATATDVNGVQSFLTGVAATRSRVWLAAGNRWRTTRTASTFNSQGLVVAEQKDGDMSDPAQTTCTRTEYAQNPTAWLLTYPKSVQTVAGPCTDANQATSQNILSDVRKLYDNQALGEAPTSGDITSTHTVDSWPAGGQEKFQVPTSQATFDEYGRVRTATDSLGRTMTTTYTPATGGPTTQVTTGHPAVVIDGRSTSLTSTETLDPATGQTLAILDMSGLRTEATYDPLGRVTAVWKPGHSRTQGGPADATYAYTVNTAQPSVVTSRRLLSSGQYATSYNLVDGLGKTVQTQNPTPYFKGGRVVADTFFDSQGREWKQHSTYWNSAAPSADLLIVQDNAVPSTAVTTFDSAGRAVASIHQVHGVERWRTTTRYDGDRTTTIPPAGATAITEITNGLDQKTQTLQYKDRARVVAGDPAESITYTYHPSGELASVTDATGENVWRYTYDLHGRRTGQSDPDSGSSSVTYDAAGQVLTTTDAKGQVLAFSYDNLGRMTGEFNTSTSGTRLAEWTYDTLMRGKPANAIRYVGGKAYTTGVTGYDAAGRPTGTTVTIPAGEPGLSGTYTFTTTYNDLSGLVSSTTSPARGGLAEETTFHNYQALDLPSTSEVVSAGGGFTLVSETQYNPSGQVLRVNMADATDPNQVSTTNTYEEDTDRLATTLTARATATNGIVLNKAYTYDPAGNPTKVSDTPQGASADTQCFAYDYLQRLTDAWTPANSDCTASRTVTALGGAAPYWQSWTYDSAGNRKQQTQHTTAGDVVTTSTYPNPGSAHPHGLISSTVTGATGTTANTRTYTYDSSGNTRTGQFGQTNHTITYDLENRVATDTDQAGKTSSYVYGADGNRLLTRDPTGTTLFAGDLELFVPAGASTATATRYYSHAEHNVGQATASSRGWTVKDEHGTNILAINASSLDVSRRYQDPFGNPRGTPPATWPDKHNFVGGYQNTTTLQRLGARDYDPTTGRFTTVDPVVDTADPQQINAYSYANNNPVTFSDPQGTYYIVDNDGRVTAPGAAAAKVIGAKRYNNILLRAQRKAKVFAYGNMLARLRMPVNYRHTGKPVPKNVIQQLRDDPALKYRGSDDFTYADAINFAGQGHDQADIVCQAFGGSTDECQSEDPAIAFLGSLIFGDAEGCRDGSAMSCLDFASTFVPFGRLFGLGKKVAKAVSEGVVPVYHGSVSHATKILDEGLDPSKLPVWVSRDRDAAADAISPGRVVRPDEGHDRGIIVSLIPQGEYEKFIAVGEQRYDGFNGTLKGTTEILLRTPEQVGIFNKYMSGLG
jgi:RHS repeat-associated protein